MKIICVGIDENEEQTFTEMDETNPKSSGVILEWEAEKGELFLIDKSFIDFYHTWLADQESGQPS